MENKILQELIIQIAESTILQKGFNFFTYREISETLGIEKALIYSYFPSKNDMGCAVVQKSRTIFQDWCSEVEKSYLGAADKLDAFFASYRTVLVDRDKICIAGMMCSEMNTLTISMQNELRNYYFERRKWLQQLLYDGLNSGVFSFIAPIEEESIFILSSLQGGLQMSRASDDYEIFLSICRQLKSQLINNKTVLIH